MTRTGDLGPVRSGSVRAVQKGRTVTLGPARSAKWSTFCFLTINHEIRLGPLSVRISDHGV